MSENLYMNEDLKNFLTEYSDIIHYSINNIKLKCFTKLKTNLDGIELFLSYDDISTIKDTGNDLLSNNVAGFLCYDVDDETYLLSIDNILEVTFDKKDFEMLEALHGSHTMLHGNLRALLDLEFALRDEFNFTDKNKEDILGLINKKKDYLDYFKEKGII